MPTPIDKQSFDAAQLHRMIAFSDSAFPIGAFAFSNGLETAVAEGVVTNERELEAYVHTQVRQVAFTDGVVALHVHRGWCAAAYDRVVAADRWLWLHKSGTECRLMSSRMGRKLVELALHLFDDPLLRRWQQALAQGDTPGCYSVAQGLLFASCGLSEEMLLCSMLYGTINLLLNAALRCMRISHYQTQAILMRLCSVSGELYPVIRECSLAQICTFTPQLDILTSMHERGKQRMFMN